MLSPLPASRTVRLLAPVSLGIVCLLAACSRPAATRESAAQADLSMPHAATAPAEAPAPEAPPALASAASARALPPDAVPTVFEAARLRYRLAQEEARAAAAERRATPAEPTALAAAFDEFASWWDAYAYAPDEAARAELVASGVAAASARRTAMADLIRTDPELALQVAVSPELRAAVPPEVAEQFEEVVEGVGRYEVDISCAIPFEDHLGAAAPIHTGDAITRTLTLGNKVYDAYVYGRRRGVTTKYALPVYGVAVDGVIALYESPVRQLKSGELPAGKATTGIAYRVGGDLREAASEEELAAIEESLVEAEDRIGPDETADSLWSEGAKTILYIRAAFANSPTTAPISESQAESNQNSVATFYAQNSYGATSVTTTITPLIVLPQTSTYYAGESWTVLLADARAAALAAGYDTSDYTFYTVATSRISAFTWAGRAYIAGSGSHFNGDFALRVAAHELGHNYGLYHANYNYTPSENPQSREPYLSAPENSPSQQYGHRYNMMGASGTTTAYHFSAREKYLLDWISDADTPIILNSGTYRLYRHDHADATGIRNLRIPAGDSSRAHYWLSFRRAFPSLPVWYQGAEVLWGRPTNVSDGTLLLDMTPFSNDGNHADSSSADNNDKVDAALFLGRMYGSPDSGAWFTVLDQGGSAPSEYLDVRVEIGNFQGNRPPVVTLEASATAVTAGQNVTLTATAEDPDGQEVVLGWDFGDGNLAGNLTQVTHSWSGNRAYSVRVTAVDGRGGRGSAHVVIRVGSPTTHTVRGRVLHDGQPVEGVRVFNGLTGTAYRGTYTDSTGAFALTHLAADDYALEARAFGYRFVPGNFANPLEVTGPVNDLEFHATAAPAPYVIVDNTDPTGVEIVSPTGSWLSLTSSAGFFGSDYITDNNTQKGQKSVTYRPSLPEDGYYRVYVRYTHSSNRASNVPIDVIHAGGENTIVVDQRTNGGLWNYLGAFAFNADGSAAVRIRTDGTNGHVAADAVKFELTTDQDPLVRLVTVTEVAEEAGAVPARLRIEREGGTSEPLTVYLGVDATIEDAATPGVDYVALPASHTFAPGETSHEITVQPIVDEEIEGTELIAVALRDAPGPRYEFTFSDPTGTQFSASANTGSMPGSWSHDIGDSTVVSGGLFRVRRVSPGNPTSWLQLNMPPSAWVYGVLETGGWVFTGTSANESVRFGFTTGQNSTVAAHLILSRDDTGVLLSGEALGTGATLIPATMVTPSISTTDRYTLVIAANAALGVYRISYRKGSEPFTHIGTGQMAAGRNPAYLRFHLVSAFGSTSAERFDVDRIAVYEADPTAPLFRFGSPSEALITLLDDPRDDWRHRYFTEADLALPAVSGWEADPDGDGMNNLLEFALGRHPRQADAGNTTQPGSVTIDGRDYLTLRVFQPAAPLTVSLIGEAGGDLGAAVWPDTAEVTYPPSDDAPPGTIETLFRDPVPLGDSPRFLRLRAELLPRSP